MLVRTQGCRICVALDAVEGIFEQHGAADGTTFSLAHGETIPLIGWASVTGVPADPPADETQVMVLRTATGLVGLRIGACLGVRSVSLARTPPMPTRLTDSAGSPLCFLLMLDGRPHLMLEPRGLLTRLAPLPGAGNGLADESGPA